ncbi:hypothetical protein ACJW31_09G173300 [Castanea mollissima]
MAENAYCIAGKIVELLGSLIYEELSSAWGVQSDLKRLECTVLAIKAVLLDAEEKQETDHRLNHWLGQLKDVFDDVENVVDEFQYQILQKEVLKRCRSTRQKVGYFFSGSNPLVIRFEMAHKIKGIRERVDDISDLKAEFNLAACLEDRKTTIYRRDMTHSFIPSQNVIGRDDDKKKIINLLMQHDVDRNVSVIPIVGIGGLGKTTIAKLVYNDEQVVRHFQLKMWVCVSEDFDVKRLITEILKSAVGIDENLSIDQLQMRLREHIKDKKFLLVLDDVSNEDHIKWIELKNLLLGGCNGSKIIVTTRNSSVATIMSTAESYNLDGLSQKDCLSLFVNLAFKEGEEEQYPNLLEIGKEIVKKCRGIPLAVNTLACLLYSKVDENTWISIRDNEICHLNQKESGILPALKLSYNQLPFHLKPCFAYCSIFPKDFVFNNLLLIQFWMAHGIIQSSKDENLELEDVGNLYIKELLSRSFFQDVEQENILQWARSYDTIREVEQSSDYYFPNRPIHVLETCISRFKYLRVLDLKNSSFEVLPSSIGSLKHLRYLDLSYNLIIKRLPDSICKLHGLQTLLLENCHNLEQLPKGIGDIIRLRFFMVTTKHTCLSEKAIGCLSSLRSLWIWRCVNLKCVFEGMEEGRLTYLRTLVVGNCPSLTSLALSIKHLTALETLIIRDCKELSLMEVAGEEENQDLKLSLQNLMFFHLPKLEVLPQWLQGSANTLQLLWIGGCENLMALPDWLPRLKSLQTLWIDNCPKLSSLPEGMEALTELLIYGCPDLSRKCTEDHSCTTDCS